MEKLIEAIKALRDRLAEINTRQEEIEAEVETKLSGKFSDELRTEYDGLGAEYDTKKAECETAEADLKRLQSRADRKLPDGPLPRRTSPGSAAPLGNGDPNSPPPNGGGERQERTRIPATVRRIGSLTNFQGEYGGRDAEERAYRFGMFILARLSQDMPGRYRFREAMEFYDQQNWAVAHHSNNATGAYNLIPDEFGRDLIDLREARGVVRRLFRKVPMTSDTRTDPRRQSGLTAYFVSEGGAGTESNKTWDNVRLTAKDLMVLARYSNQVGMDAVISIGDDLAGEIAYAFSDKEDECGLNGDATSAYGHITGARTALVAAAGTPTTTSAGGVIVAAGNAYSEITLANFQSVVGVLPQYADTPMTSWVVHRTFYFGVMQRVELAAGGVTAQEISDGRRKPRPLFLGYPVTFSQVMPSTEANSQLCALLGDFTKGAAFGDRQMDSIDFSEHATVGGENVFERNQVAIRGTERFDINVHDVGNTTTAGPIVGLQTLNS